MASASKSTKADPVEAAVDYFSGRSHDAWRKNFLQSNPDQKGKPRMRLRGGAMVDINQPWAKLDRRAKEDNKKAARDAYDAVKRFPNDREAAADYVHKCWIKRNKSDASQPKELFKPYSSLPEAEKDKDRAHVDRMKAALAAVRTRAPKKTSRRPVKKAKAASKAKPAGALKTVRVDARSWGRLERASKQLSAALGREVTPEALMSAGIEAVTAICKTVARKG